MKNLVIRAIGRPTEPWQREAIHMYEKRLEPFGGVEIIELPEGHKGSSRPNDAKTRGLEAESLLKGIPDNALVVALDERGKALRSDHLAERLSKWTENKGKIIFLIGGSWGFDASIKDRADVVLSFGPMTLPHGLARIVLLEQIYRAKMISAGREYHK